MRLVCYTAILERSRSGFGVFFPDVPGCVSAGRTELETLRNAEEALTFHLVEMVRAGEPIPKPSREIPTDPEVQEFCRALIRVTLPGRKKRVNVMIDEGVLAAIDAVSPNRSRFLEEAARKELAA